MQKQKNKERGITLVALVITIVILIILAGVSIAMLVGENGIITQAQKAKENTELAEQKEKEEMEKLEDEINEYAGINWDTVLANAKKHPDQKTSTAIGVGTNGRPVNMDLWKYTLLEDGTYALNSSETIKAVQEENWSGATMGYLGTFTEDGEIDGVLPQYIKEETDDSFIPITDLTFLFARSENIKVMPKIPDTVTNMYNTFLRCINLTTLSSIPVGVINMSCTFSYCTSLINAPEIPNTVENMMQTFEGCTSLTNGPTIIKDNVTNLQRT